MGDPVMINTEGSSRFNGLRAISVMIITGYAGLPRSSTT
jgi:hypothetical protein